MLWDNVLFVIGVRAFDGRPGLAGLVGIKGGPGRPGIDGLPGMKVNQNSNSQSFIGTSIFNS